jgi:hypothetical protein
MQSEHIGYNYRDLITGFKGVCTGHTVYISGCSQLLLQPPVDDAGRERDGKWVDEQRCQREDACPRIVLDNSSTPGCDIPAPMR